MADMSSEPAFDRDDLDTASIDALFSTLSDPVRRDVISYLAARANTDRADADLSVNIATVADHLSVTLDAPQQHVTAILHHNHLPYLDDHGFITYEDATVYANSERVHWANNAIELAVAADFTVN